MLICRYYSKSRRGDLGGVNNKVDKIVIFIMKLRGEVLRGYKFDFILIY